MGGSSGGAAGGGSAQSNVEMPPYLRGSHQGMIHMLSAHMKLDVRWAMDRTYSEILTDGGLDDSAFGDEMNPFFNACAYDPTTDLDRIQDRLASYAEFVEGMSHVTDWQSFRTAAEDELDTDTRWNWETRHRQAERVGALDRRLDYDRILELARRLGDFDSRVDWETAFCRAKERTNADRELAFPKMIRDVEQLLPAGSLQWDKIFASAERIAKLDDLDWEELTRMVLRWADELVLSVSVIDRATAEHARDGKQELARELGEYNAGMRDIGAVNGSAFKIGEALLRNRHLARVDRFRAEMSLDQHRLRINYILESVRTAAQIKQGKESLGLQIAQAKMDTAAKFLDVIRSVIATRLGLLFQASDLIGRLDGLKRGQDLDAVRAVAGLETAKLDYLLRAVGQLGDFERMKVGALSGATDELVRMLQIRLNAESGLTHLNAEINRVGIVAQRERYDQDLDINKLYFEWPYEVAINYGNILASYAGGTVSRPGKGAQGSSSSANGGSIQGAASGAISGATIGFMVGGPVGAVKGGALGGAAGYFGG